MHLARAEYFLLNGLTGKALQQLTFALRMDGNDNLTNTRIAERIKQVQQIQNALKSF